MIEVKIEEHGMAHLQEWLIAAPVKLELDMLPLVELGIDHMSANVDPFTPTRTGLLMSSKQTEVHAMVGGAWGKVFTHVGYAKYVEHGTEKHGRARHMYLRGLQIARPYLEYLAEDEARAFAESL